LKLNISLYTSRISLSDDYSFLDFAFDLILYELLY